MEQGFVLDGVCDTTPSPDASPRRWVFGYSAPAVGALGHQL